MEKEARKNNSKSTPHPDNYIFSEETVKALQEFGEVLLRIHRRLVAEGKTIEVDAHYAKRDSDGKIHP